MNKTPTYVQTILVGLVDQISRIRRQQELSLSAVGRLSGISLPAVRSVEQGTGSIASLMAVLSALDTQFTWHGKNHRDDIGACLAEARRASGQSQRTLAAMIGCSPPTIVALERRSKGRMSVLELYCKAVGVVPELEPLSGKALHRRLVPKKNAPDRDVVLTPRVLARSIIEHHPLSGTVLDPCRGEGAFFDQFPDHVTSEWCEITDGRDFLRWQVRADWVVSNPPWSKMREFLRHSMEVADNVVFLAALTHFTTRARIADIEQAGFGIRSILLVPQPEGWPASGFQSAAIWIKRGWAGPSVIKRL